MAILNFDGGKFVKFSVVSTIMGFPVMGIFVVGFIALISTYVGLRRFDTWAPIGKHLLGVLGLFGAHLAAAAVFYSADANRAVDSFGHKEDPAFGLTFLLWFVLFVIGMVVLYRGERIYSEGAKKSA